MSWGFLPGHGDIQVPGAHTRPAPSTGVFDGTPAELLSTSCGREMQEVAGKDKPGMSLGTFQKDLCLQQPLQVGFPNAAAQSQTPVPLVF